MQFLYGFVAGLTAARYFDVEKLERHVLELLQHLRKQ